jgi:lipid-binding SYLF domain-containing protein
VEAVSRRVACGLLAGTLVLTPARFLAAEDAQEAQQLVARATFTVNGFVADPQMGGFRDLVKKARAVYISPEVVRAGFILGGSGGSGLLLARHPQTGRWSDPAFYTIGSASFGFQAGVEASEVVLLVLTERGVNALLNSTVKLGGDASVAVGPVGAGVSGATAALSADLIAYARSKGLYGGITIDGAVVAVRAGWNDAYYGKSVTPADILIRQTVRNSQSAGLVQEITRASAAP